MIVEELVICPLSQVVYIIEPNHKEEELYRGDLAKIPERLMGRKITCMYSAYNEKEKIPVLVIDVC